MRYRPVPASVGGPNPGVNGFGEDIPRMPSAGRGCGIRVGIIGVVVETEMGDFPMAYPIRQHHLFDPVASGYHEDGKTRIFPGNRRVVPQSDRSANSVPPLGERHFPGSVDGRLDGDGVIMDSIRLGPEFLGSSNSLGRKEKRNQDRPSKHVELKLGRG